MSSRPDDLKRLTDAALVLEITHAQRMQARAIDDLRNQRHNISDAAARILDGAVAAAENSLRACLAEQQRRLEQGAWNPVPASHGRTVVKKSASPTKSVAPGKSAELARSASPVKGAAPAARAARSVSSLPRHVGAEPEAEAPEAVPIIVFDGLSPRAWRKGDPIY